MAEETVQEMIERHAKREVDRILEEHRLPIQQRAADKELGETLRLAVIAHGAKEESARHLVGDAKAVLELKDGALVARDGATQRTNPLREVTLDSWLTEARKEFPEFFKAEQTSH